RGPQGGGASRAIACRGRRDAGWAEQFPATDLAQRKGARAARPGLIRATELLAGVLRDFPEQPRARDVADALGDADMLLGRYAQANGDYERAIELSRPHAADADLQLASLAE